MPKRSASKIHRAGFTLVELLVVVGIVAILAALGIPAVMRAIKSTQAAAVKLEIDMLSQALEDYRTKYGEYPPDGSSASDFARHCRKAFPGILASELQIFVPSTTFVGPEGADVANANFNRVMEQGEALVLFLGGLSNDPQRPFTGPGGPILKYRETTSGSTTTSYFQYNVARTNALFEFDSARLTTTNVTDTPSGQLVTVSSDESLYSYSGKADILPAFKSKYSESPVVYFCSRTYQFPTTEISFSISPLYGLVVPYLSTERNTATTALEVDPIIQSLQSNQLKTPVFFANKSSFQLVAAGFDNVFDNLHFQTPPPSGTSTLDQIKSDPMVRLRKFYAQMFADTNPKQSSDVSYDNVVNFVDVSSVGDAARKVEANK